MEGISINELYKAVKYEEIVAFWENEETRTHLNDWDRWYILLSFNKLKRYQETLEAYRQMRSERGETFEADPWQRMEDAVGWALYYVHIKPFDPEQGDSHALFKQVDYIVRHCQNSEYSPLIKTVLLVTKWMKDGKLSVQPDYQRMSEYLSTVNPELLSTEENHSGDGKPYASDRELWYIPTLPPRNAENLIPVRV